MSNVEHSLLSREFVCGLIVGEGCFSVVYHSRDQRYVPTFEIRMHIRDKDLIEKVRDAIGLTETWVYEYTHGGRHYCGFIVRRTATLLNVVIPYFDGYLDGYKKTQFDDWKNFIIVMKNVRINKKLAVIIAKQKRDEVLFKQFGI